MKSEMKKNQLDHKNYSIKGVTHRIIENSNGLKMHTLDSGFISSEQEVVLLLHGFPELAFSWRHVIYPLINNGYRVIAPDQRGYGMTTGGSNSYNCDLSSFQVQNLVIDLLGLLFKIGVTSVKSVIGHDFGAYVAAYCALIRPDIFKSTIIMSAPFGGPPSLSPLKEKHTIETQNINEDLKNLSPPRKHYHWYYTTKTANADMHNCPQGIHNFLRAYFHYKSADWVQNKPFPLINWSAQELAKLPSYYIMDLNKGMAETVSNEMPSPKKIDTCSWLSEEELSVYSSTFNSTGFQGGLNWYRCRLSPAFTKELAIFSERQIDVPSYFIGGQKDWGIHQSPGSFEAMSHKSCSNFKGYYLIESSGHWVQQEQPKVVSNLFLKFLADL